MTTDMLTAHIDQNISEVRKILVENPIHHIPVVIGRKLVGLISSADMRKLSFALLFANKPVNDEDIDKQFTIEEIMQKDIVTVNAKETIHRAAEMFCGGQFHSLPVLDDKHDLAGIVTSTDMIMYLLDQYKS